MMKVQTLLILFVINICSGLVNDRVDMVSRYFDNYLLFFVAAVSGSLFLIGVANRTKKNRLLKYIGKNSFFLLGFNKINLLIILILCEKFNVFQLQTEKTILMFVDVIGAVFVVFILREITLKLQRIIKQLLYKKEI